MDSTALLAAIIGVAYGAAVSYRAMKRQWRAASGVTAIGSVVLLNVVTMGNRSHSEHRVVLIVSLILILFFFVFIGATTKVRQHNG